MPIFLHRILPAIPAADRFSLIAVASIIAKFLLPKMIFTGDADNVHLRVFQEISGNFRFAANLQSGDSLFNRNFTQALPLFHIEMLLQVFLGHTGPAC